MYEHETLRERGHAQRLAPGVRAWLGTSALRFAALCVLTLVTLIALSPSVRAESKYAAVIVDANSGDVLYDANGDATRFPASLTKIMTIYIVFEMIEAGRLSLDADLLITETAARQQPTKLGLPAGARIKVRDAISALVTRSANDIAVALAENIAGTEEKFARYMTWKAQQIGMTGTVFRNASGLPDSRQVTTARDMATLGLAVMDDYPQHYHFFSQRTFTYKGRSHRNHNGLLHSYSGTDGIKTGYIRASGFNLVASVRRGPKRLVGVVMGGASAGRRNQTMRTLMNKAFERASTRPTRLRQRVPTPYLVHSPPQAGSSRLASESGERPSPAPMTIASLALAATRSPAPSPATPVALTSRVAAPPIPSPAANVLPVVASLRAPSPRAAAPAQPAPSPSEARAGTAPAAPANTGPTVSGGGFHVQVGAYTTEAEALRRLANVRGTASSLLDRRDDLTMRFEKGGRAYYRARFAGFSQPEAQSTCAALKARSVECVVMTGQ
ncbi:MAG: D-alanyl-D-alanine carboxypeptidase [Rhizobiales bacterium]|nr:D-alanyl-D-alanine carboxypeptidase [Hyphomicrobiales bacterium]